MPSAFATAFLAGAPAARGFLARDFRAPLARVEAVRAAATRSVSPDALAVLREQDAALPPSLARRRHLDALATPGTAVVITGQQVGLFLGPLYTFYKAATTVAVARALAAESGVPCVPLFWLQTEDHDYPEVNHCFVRGRDGAPHRVALPDDPAGAAAGRVSIKHRTLGAEIAPALESIGRALPAGPAADDVRSRLATHYRSGCGLGEAFAGLLGELFADDGLLVFDPRDARIAARAAPLYRRALLDHADVTQALVAAGQDLAAAGFDAQVHVRPQSPLVFFAPEGAAGPRHRLEPDGPGRWQAGATHIVTTDDLMAALARAPLQFSTSTLLRPLVQDTLFPCAAYVGGPAELSYFAQLRGLYDLFGVAQPLVVQRARFRCIDARTRARLGKLHLSARDVEESTPQALIERIAAQTGDGGAPDSGALRAGAAREILDAIDRLATIVRDVDPSLARPAERTRVTAARALDRLLGKYARVLLDRDATTARRLRAVCSAILPDGMPQERRYGWPDMAARAGASGFKNAIDAALVPFATAVREVEI